MSSDILNAFLEMAGASTLQSTRINLLPGEGGSLAGAAKIIAAGGGEVLGVGTNREPGRQRRGFFVRSRGLDAATAAAALRQSGYTGL